MTPCANITKWVEISPLELKLTIEEQKLEALAVQAKQGKDAKLKFDYDKENSCSICMCELYDGLESSTMDQVIKDQKSLRDGL